MDTHTFDISINQTYNLTEEEAAHINEMRENKLLEDHPYEITQGRGKDKRFFSYLPDSTKKNNRKKIAAPTKELLEKKIIAFYRDCQKDHDVCIRQIFSQWIKYKKLTTSESNANRLIKSYKEHYIEDKIIDIDLNKLTNNTISEFLAMKVKEKNMNKKQFEKMYTIISQIVTYAFDEGMIHSNPMISAKKPNNLIKKTVKKDASTEVFSNSEVDKILKECDHDFKNKDNDCIPLAIKLAFYTGLRKGELVALKFSDFDFESGTLNVQRMEISYQSITDATNQEHHITVVDHLKSNHPNRIIIIPKEAIEIVKKLEILNSKYNFQDDDYLFISKRTGKRIHTRALDLRISIYCKNINISNKSMHKIRKTYISSLIDAGLNMDFIRNQAGHQSELTTFNSYHYDITDLNERLPLLEKALAY